MLKRILIEIIFIFSDGRITTLFSPQEIVVSVSMHDHVPQIVIDFSNPHFVCIHNKMNTGSDIKTLSSLSPFDSTVKMIPYLKNNELQGSPFIIDLALFYKNHWQDLKFDKTGVDLSIFATGALLNVRNKFDVNLMWQIDFENSKINMFYQLEHYGEKLTGNGLPIGVTTTPKATFSTLQSAHFVPFSLESDTENFVLMNFEKNFPVEKYLVVEDSVSIKAIKMYSSRSLPDILLDKSIDTSVKNTLLRNILLEHEDLYYGKPDYHVKYTLVGLLASDKGRCFSIFIY